MFDRREILLLLQAMQEKRSKAAVRDHCVPRVQPPLATAGSRCRFELCVACHVLEILQGEGDPQRFILRFSQNMDHGFILDS